MDLSLLIAALRSPAAYPHDVAGPIEVIQTHISVVFLAGDRVYKVKKPVDLGFVDFSTLERRRHFCEEEVRLNRRLAPNVYLGAVPITRADGAELRIGGEGETIEWAVSMRRLPAGRMLNAMLERGAVEEARLNELVDRLVRFHRACPTGPGVDEHAAPQELRRQLWDNLDVLERFAGEGPDAVVPPRLLGYLRATAGGFLDERRELLERRLREGRVREGHGDLHAGNICLEASGIVVYDCIEFTPRFRCRDVAAEMSFLAMDLDVRGFGEVADHLLDRYARETGDRELPRLARYYRQHFAIVRAKVAALRSVDCAVEAGQRVASRREARRYLLHGAGYALPPAIVVMCGLPGTGKSTAARAIARPLRAAVLGSDVTRKALAGLAPGARGGAGAGLYGRRMTDRTYAALREAAREQLTRDRSVVLDATFATVARRAVILRLAAEAGAEALIVETISDAETVRRRLEARRVDATEPSDADWSVYLSARAHFEPPDELPPEQRVRLEGEQADDEIAARVVEALVRVSRGRSAL